MKLVTYDAGRGPRVGALENGEVVDLGFDGNMVAFIEAGAPVGKRTRVGQARLLAPLRPRSMRDFLSFEGHLHNALSRLGRPIPSEWFEVPAYYKGMPDTVIGPEEEGTGDLVTRFELSWPEQRAARIMRGPHGPLQPVRIIVNYSQGFLHPHLSRSIAGFWPFQVTSAADAERQKSILAAIVGLELHQRIFETNWRILPVSQQLE